MSTVRGVSILGSTGTIGRNTIDVLERYPDRYRIIALTAHRNVNEMFEQCVKYSPLVAVMRDENAAEELEARLKGVGSETRVHAGVEGLICAATLGESETVMAAIVGAAGLIPTLQAVKAGKRVLLANKEGISLSRKRNGPVRRCCPLIVNTMRYSSACRATTGQALWRKG